MKSVRLVLAAVVLASGCATVRLQDAFHPVGVAGAERSGKEIAWMGVTEPEERIIERVNLLLADDLTAEDAVQIALLFNRRLQARYAEAGIAAADLAQAGLPRNPAVELTALFRSGSVHEWEVGVAQDFLSLLFLPLRRQLASAELERVQLELTAEVLAVAWETRLAFYDLQAAQQHLELFQSVLLAMEASYEWAWLLREAGNIPLVFMLRERVPYEQAKLQAAEAELRVVEQRERLNRLMGLWGGATAWTAALRLPPVPERMPEFEDLERRAVEASLELAAARQQMLVLARGSGLRNIEEVFPELEVGAQFEREPKLHQQPGGRLEESNVWLSGPTLRLPVPLFDQGQAAQVRNWARLRQEWDEFTALAVDVRSAARLAQYRLQYAWERARYYEQVVLPVQNQFLLQMQLRYNAMFTGTIELLDAARQNIEAGQEYVEAMHGYWRAHAEAEQLLAGSLPRDMGGAPVMNPEGPHHEERRR